MNLGFKAKQRKVDGQARCIKDEPTREPTRQRIMRIKGRPSLKPREYPANGLSGLPLGKSGTLQT